MFEGHIDDRRRDLRGDERITVAVAADPRAKGQGATVDGEIDVEAREALDELDQDVGDGASHESVDEVEGVARFVEHFGLFEAQLVGEPELVDHFSRATASTLVTGSLTREHGFVE